MPNESLIHADIFFFISTIVLVIFSIAFGMILFYVLRIVKNVRDITDRLRAESVEIVEDLKKFRGMMRDEGLKWKHVASLIRAFFTRRVDSITKPLKKFKK